MRITGFRGRYLPHILNLALFLLVSLIYFFPVIEGKKLRAHDNTVYLSASREISEYRDKYGEEALWTNSMFSGMPAYLISTLYPGNLIHHIDKAIKTLSVPVAAIFLAMAGFYILLLFYGLNPWVAGAGAIAYSFSSYFFIILGAGHNTKAFALAYMAPMIGSIIYAYRKNVFHGALFLAWFLSLELMASHLQITYYALLTILLFGATELIFSIKDNRAIQFLKNTALLIVPVIIAVAINFGTILTTYEYSKYSMRGKSELTLPPGQNDRGLQIDYATEWSYGIDETMTLLIPSFKGGASDPFPDGSETYEVLRKNNSLQYARQLPSYWGAQRFTSGPVYVGAIVFFMFVMGLFILKGPDKWWLLAATLLALLLSWGRNLMWFTRLFMDYVPGYDKFRGVSMSLVIAEFTIPLLAFLAFNTIVDRKLPAGVLIKGMKNAAAVTGGLLLLFILFPRLSGSFLSDVEQGQLPQWLSAAMAADRLEMLRSDAIRSFIFVTLTVSLIYLFLKDRLQLKFLIPALLALILADMWPVNKRYMGNDKFVSATQFSKGFSSTRADDIILKDPGINRVLNISVSTFNDASTSYFHQSVGGYHGAKLRRYQELIDSVMTPELQALFNTLNTAQTEGDLMKTLSEMTAFNMLNTKYIIYNPDANPITNPYAAGNAWFADTVIMVSDSNEELEKLPYATITQAIVTDEFRDMAITGRQTENNSTDYIRLVSYKPNELVYHSSSVSQKTALFSEIYYPAGWKSWIDGVEQHYFRANYVLRALSIPAGEHEIVFRFKPESYYTGNKVALAGSVLLFLITAGFIIMLVVKRKPE